MAGFRQCRRSALALAAAFALTGASGVLADEKARHDDKSLYTLFNPTPAAMLRDMSTDRPDTTESPFTVDAGHVQIETTIFGYSRTNPESDGAYEKSFEFGTTNIRIGLTNSAEINFVFQPYGVVRAYPGGVPPSVRSAGIGAVDIRAKFNLWGNDTFDKRGDSAFGLLPFITIPTDRSNGISPDGIEGGLILPYALVLTDEIGLGVNGGFHIVRNGGGGHHTEYLASASLSYEWSERLGTYYEVAARFNTQDPRGDIVVLATGFTYALGDNLQLDAGINFGVTHAADRFNPFVGVSARF